MFIDRLVSDAHLVKLTLSGRQAAFDRLVRRYLNVVHAVAYSRVGNHADAEDVAQNAFVSAYRSLHTLQKPASFGAWLLTITRNGSTRFVQDRQRFSEIHEQAYRDIDDEVSPNMEERDSHELVRARLLELSDTDREILLLHYFSGKSTREIATVHDITPSAVKKRLQRAREALGDRLLKDAESILTPERAKAVRLRKVVAAVAASVPLWREASAAAATSGMLGSYWSSLSMMGIASVVAGTMGIVGIALLTAPSHTPDVADSGVSEMNTAYRATDGQRVLREVDASSEVTHPTPQLFNVNPHGPRAPVATRRGNGVLGGVITDHSGRVVEGARVTAIEQDRDNTNEPMVPDDATLREVKTDANGRFWFTGMPWGNYRVRAYKDDSFGVRSMSISAERPYDLKKMDVEPFSAISGVVLDESGTAVPNATVSAYEKRTNGNWFSNGWSYLYQVTTDTDGRFTLDHLALDEWRLLAQAQGRACAISGYIRSGSQDIVLTLERGSNINGRVRHKKTGQPVEQVGVTAVSVNDSRDRHVVETDTEGRYSISGLRETPYLLLVSAHGTFVNGSEPPTVSPGSDGAVTGDLAAIEGGVISGVLIDESTGKGLSGVELQAYGSYGNAVGRSDSAGSFRIEGLSSGKYGIRPVFDAPGMRCERVTAMVQAATVTENVVLKVQALPRVVGTVRNALGEPVANACIRISPVDRYDGGLLSPDNLYALSSQSGQFSGALPAGSEAVNLRAYAPGKVSLPVTVSAGALETVTLTLHDDAGISGRVVDAASLGMEGQNVLCVTVDGKATMGTSSGPGGAFTFMGLSPGQYKVTTQSPSATDDANEILTLESGQYLHDLVIGIDGVTQDTALQGRVFNASGKPVANANVTVSNATGTRTTTTDVQGRFTVRGVPNQEWWIGVRHPEYTPLETGADPSETSIDLVLEELASIEMTVIASDTRQIVRHVEAVVEQGQVSPFLGLQMLDGSRPLDSDDSGRFVIEKVPAGTATLFIRTDGYRLSATTLDNIAPGKRLKLPPISLEPAPSIKGLVVDFTGQPIAGASILGCGVPLELDAISFPLARTDGTGSFEVASLPVNVDQITASHPDFANASQHVPKTAPSQPLRFVLSQGSSIHGSLVAPPESSAQIFCYEHQDGNLEPQVAPKRAVINEDGSYAIEHIGEGIAKLVATASANGVYWSWTREISLNREQSLRIDVDFGQGHGTLQGRFVSKNPKWSHAEVVVTADAGGTTTLATTPADENGSFRIEGLPSGLLKIAATSRPDLSPIRVEPDNITLVAGEPFVGEFRLLED